MIYGGVSRIGPLSGQPKKARSIPPGTKPIHAGKTSWGIHFCANTCGACMYSHLREYRKSFLRNRFPHSSHILEGIYFGANTCRACIHTRANAGKDTWRIIYVLVSCQGVQPKKCKVSKKGQNSRKQANNAKTIGEPFCSFLGHIPVAIRTTLAKLNTFTACAEIGIAILRRFI